MSTFPAIEVHHPRAFDIVDRSFKVCGISNVFEASFNARLRDANGNVIKDMPVFGGGGVSWKAFDVEISLDTPPQSPSGTLEMYDLSAENGEEINKVVVPIVYGPALVESYEGYTSYTVKPGDTLSKISQAIYGSPRHHSRIFEANRHILTSPHQISPGQVLRMPL